MTDVFTVLPATGVFALNWACQALSSPRHVPGRLDIPFLSNQAEFVLYVTWENISCEIQFKNFQQQQQQQKFVWKE